MITFPAKVSLRLAGICFTHSTYVETCVLLGRKNIDDVRYAYVDYEPTDAEYLNGISGSATHREIREWVKKEYNLNVTSLNIAQVKEECGFEKRSNYNTSYIAQVKQMCGLDVGENYNKSKKENPDVKQCSKKR